MTRLDLGRRRLCRGAALVALGLVSIPPPARALGLSIPSVVLSRADAVIE